MFLGNAVLMSVVSIVMRGIAVSFNAYIHRKTGAEAMGLFTLVMSVYGFAVTVALSCVNLAAVRLTSERCAALEDCGADRASWRFAMRKVVGASCRYSLIFGGAAGVLLFLTAEPAARFLLKDLRTVRSLRVLAVSLPAISLSSALSGYFTGLRKVSKNAVITVSEQFMKILVTSTALAMILPGNVESACLAVVGGSAIAEAWSLVMNVIFYLTDSGSPAGNGKRFGKCSVRLSAGLRDAAAIALPSAVGAYARQGLTTLEHLAIPAGLKKSGLTPENALAVYGTLQGIAFPLVMFPYAVIGSFTALLIPETAEKCHELGGVYIAAHIDRPNFSVYSQLGAIPEGFFDAVELSRTADDSIWMPKAEGYSVIRSSDAHNLDDVARVWTEMESDDFTVDGLKSVFASKATSISSRLVNF
jgi:stage V sporulation protein B